jgi:hypothetical protein
VAWTVAASNGVSPEATVSGSEVVPANLAAPSLSASDSLSGRTLTIAVNSLTGAPTPTVALRTLTLDGADVRAAAVGTGPWSYAVPASVTARTVAWTVAASNGVSPEATVSGSEVVPANLAAPSASGRLADLTLTIGVATGLLDVASDFTGTAPITYTLAPSSAALPAGLTLSSAGVISGAPTEAVAARSIVVRATNAAGFADSGFSLTVNAAGGALAGLTIASTRTAIVGGEGVVFRATGVSEETLRDTTFWWDFGASEAYDFVSPDSTFRGDRNARWGQGSVVGHVFLNGTGASVTRDVTLYAVTSSGEMRSVALSDAGQAGVISVADPAIFYRNRTAWVGRADLYTSREAFRTAAQAGTVTGIDPTEAAGKGIEFFHLDYAVAPGGVATGALYAWRSNTSPAAVKRILLQRGGVWPWERPGAFGYDPRQIESLGAFGAGDRPRFQTSAPNDSRTTANVERIFFLWSGSTLPFGRRFVVNDIDFVGTYDPANPNRSDLGVIDHGSAARMFSPEAAAAADTAMHWTFFRVRTRGLGQTISDGGQVGNLVAADMDIGDWLDYGVITSLRDSAIVGCRIKQPLDTKFNPPNVTNPKDYNPASVPNWSHHGAMRIASAFNVGVHQCDLRQRGGWTDGEQPVIRAGVAYVQVVPNPIKAAFPEFDGDALAYARYTFAQGQRHHMSIAGNHLDGNNSGIVFNQANEDQFIVPPLMMLSQANYVEMNRGTKGGGSTGFISASVGNVVSRGDYFYAPNWLGGAGGFTVVGAGSAPATVMVPNDDLDLDPTVLMARLGNVRIINPTIVSRHRPTSGAVVRQDAPQWFRERRQASGVAGNTSLSYSDFYTHNYKRLHELVRRYLALPGVSLSDPTPADPNTVWPYDNTPGSGWATWTAWANANWATMVADPRMKLEVGFRPDAMVEIVNPLYIFGDSTVTATSFETPVGANLTRAGFYRPPVGSSVLGASTGGFARHDFFAQDGARPVPPALGALEATTDLSHWTPLPEYAAPIIAARFQNAAGNAYTPQFGDVFGTNFFGGAVITVPGVPALTGADVAITVERNAAGAWTAMTAGQAVTTGDQLRVTARAQFHPAADVTNRAVATVASQSDQFSANAVRFDGDFISAIQWATPAQPQGRAFTFAIAIRPWDNTVNHLVIHQATTGPHLSLGAKNVSNGNAGWQVIPHFSAGGGVAATSAGNYNNVGEAEFMVFTGRFDENNVARLRLWRNGQALLFNGQQEVTRQGDTAAQFNFSNLRHFAFSTTPSGRVDVSRFAWLHVGAALDPAATTTALFDLGANAARDLGPTGVINVGGVNYAPTFYVAGPASEWNAGTARTGQRYMTSGSVSAP